MLFVLLPAGLSRRAHCSSFVACLLTDLIMLFVLLVFVVVAFVSALYVVEPSWTGSDELDLAARSPACADFYILGGSWNNWLKLAFLVLNAVVDGRAQDALFMCVLHEQNQNRYLLWTFTYLLLLFVVVLLLNMLIAMFSRSFDLMYDSMTSHVQTHFARVRQPLIELKEWTLCIRQHDSRPEVDPPLGAGRRRLVCKRTRATATQPTPGTVQGREPDSVRLPVAALPGRSSIRDGIRREFDRGC